MADDAIVAQYIVKTDAAIANLNKLSAQVANIQTTSQKSAKGSEDAFSKMSDNISNQFKALGQSLVAAFAVDRLVTFGKESVMLAGKVEGVKIAFDRLNKPDLLNQLREATKGTVSDLGLMTAAVRAQNFKIPLEQMATLLEFARRRAKETGEDINFLVESIVVGIGRKSPLILDNLGISAIELRKRFQGISIEAAEVGDVAKIVGDIATDSLKEMGEEALTTGDSIAQLTAAWENQKAEIGKALVQLLQFYGVLKDIRPDEILKAKNAEDLANATARINMELKGITDTQGKLNKLAEIEAKAKDIALGKQARLAEIDQQRKDLLRDILHAESKAESFRNGQRQYAGEYDKAIALREQLALLEKVALGEKASLGFAIDYTEAIKVLRSQLQKTVVDAVPFIDNLTTIGQTVKGLNDQLQLLPVFTQQWINKFNELEKANVRLNAAKNLVENLKDEIEKPAEFNIEPIEEESDALADFYEYSKTLAKDNDDYMRMLRENRYRDGLALLDKETEAAKKKEEDLRFAINATSQIAQSLIAADMEMDTRANEYAQRLLDERLKNGLISQKEYEKESAIIRYNQAAQEKQAALFSAMISTFAAVAEALPNIPQSILAGVLGGIQIAMIASEPLPTFGKGGWVEGKKHSQGGTMIEAEKGEFIVSAASAAKYAPILDQINEGTFTPPEHGWAGLAGSIELNAGFTDRNLLAAIDRHRETDSKLLRVIADRLTRQTKRRGYA